MSTPDFSTLISESNALTAHLAPNDLPSLHLGFEQIEAQARRLIARQPTVPADTGKASYLLAQAQVDASALAQQIATLNPATTFSPLQPLHDTDVSGYLRHAHEQGIISTIEEGRRETQIEFERVLNERVRRDWEARKKKIFEELGERAALLPESRHSTWGHGKQTMASSELRDIQQPRMMAYDPVITSFNSARLANTPIPILRHLMGAVDEVSSSIYQTYELLASIVEEPQGLLPVEHPAAHLGNAPVLERKFARAYLGDPDTRDSAELRMRIASGARTALETQYWDIVTRTIAARPQHAALGGDPSIASHIRAFLNVKFYQSGVWEERLELIAGQPLWAKLFYLVRTGHIEEALSEALYYELQISQKERHFITYFKAWVYSPNRQLSKSERNQLQATYNSHILHTPTTDPFKLALFKVIGKLDPSRRTVPLVTATTEDWLWFQLAMLDEQEGGGLRTLGEVLMGYGERHFEGTPGQKARKGMWARVLIICGQFERAVSALYELPEFQVDAVHLAVALAYYGLLRVPSRAESSDVDILTITASGQGTLNFALLISRYIRQFLRVDPRVALQYVYSVCLSADQEGVGREQVEIAWELCRRVILMAEAGGGWEDLVGGFTADGTRFTGIIERDKRLLKLRDDPNTGTSDYTDQILLRAARQSEREKHVNEAIKLYYLAGDHETVVACLARVLGDYIGDADDGGSEGAVLNETAKEILKHYERTNKGAGRSRDAVIKLIKIREARSAKNTGQLEKALELMESTGIYPTENDVTLINKKVQALKDYDETVIRNLRIFLPLHMDILVELRNRRRSMFDVANQSNVKHLIDKALALQKFATNVKYSMSPDVHAYLSRSIVDMKN